ncbi:polyprenyl synthetase family protein [bacterium]|nr:polyprenyl synthetase family protein [candidate division CSSED10-310 bacterium]
MIFSFNSIKDHLRTMDERITDCFNDSDPQIREAIAPYLLNQGKRIRPTLVYLSTLATSSDVTAATHRYALVTELIHCASLFHDDVLDNAMKRRGQPSANRLYGNDTAVLIGDFLYMRALMLMESDRIKLRRAVYRAVTAMTQAEISQGLKRYRILTESDYFRIIEGKTAALISLCALLGASISGNGKWMTTLSIFGRQLGIAFQLIDDLLDWTGGIETGKDRHCDIREGRITLPLIRLLATMDHKETARCNKDLLKSDSPPDKEIIDKYMAMMMNREIDQAIRTDAGNLLSNAAASLNQLPDTTYRRELLEFSDRLIRRSL